MAKIALNKSSLTKEKNALKGYNQFLPALELKQQQLRGLEAKAKRELKNISLDIENHMNFIEDKLPMILNEKIDLESLISVQGIEIEEESVIGIKLPKIKDIHFNIKEYSLYNTVHWIDTYVQCMKDYILLKKKYDMQEERLGLIAKAVLKITQRVNLFDKILIPNAEDNIKRINIAISDDERSAVVRSKIAKSMHERERGEA